MSGSTTGRLRLGLLGVVVSATLLAGCATPISPAPRVAELGLPQGQFGRAARNLALFDAVWSTVNREYYDPQFRGVDWNAAALAYGPRAAVAADDASLYRVLNEMLGLLDDEHTAALAPEVVRAMRRQQRVMSGFRSVLLSGRAVVEEVFPGGPAEEAGVKPGWIVTSRDGVAYRGGRMESRSGKPVVWGFLDEMERPVSLSLADRAVPTARREVRRFPGGVVYLRFDQFDLRSARWLSEQLSFHRNAPGVVLDLRRCPGGTVLSLDFILAEFFDRSFEFARYTDRSGKAGKLGTITLGSARYGGKLAVLVGGSSASCAEVFAAAIQERERGLVIGRKTAGDVLVSRRIRLPGGGALQYSKGDLLTSQGRRLEGVGLNPDVETPVATLADLRMGRDPDLETALGTLSDLASAD